LLFRGVFVTGTDTGVGKTVASAALMRRYRDPSETPASRALRYWKPIQTGIEQDDDSGEVRRLAECNDDEVWDEGVRLRRPVSPHLAAALAGERIDLDHLAGRLAAQDPDDHWIVEGAGGVLVPVNEREVMADLMVKLGLAVLVVARTTLGTINHTLLTLEALRARSLTVAGVFLAGDPVASNTEAIERYGGVRVVAELPRLDPLTPDTLAAHTAGLDPTCYLEQFLKR
jgi:dethiobiotin synthase